MDCSLPGSSIHRIFQARILEWGAIAFSRRSSRPRNWTQVSLIIGRHFSIWGTREAPQLPHCLCSSCLLICVSALFPSLGQKLYESWGQTQFAPCCVLSACNRAFHRTGTRQKLPNWTSTMHHGPECSPAREHSLLTKNKASVPLRDALRADKIIAITSSFSCDKNVILVFNFLYYLQENLK